MPKFSADLEKISIYHIYMCIHTHTHTHTHIYIERERELAQVFQNVNSW